MPTEIDVIIAELSKEILQKRHEISEEKTRLDIAHIRAFAQLDGLNARKEGIYFMFNQQSGIVQRDPNQITQKKKDLAHIVDRIAAKKMEITRIESDIKNKDKTLKSLKRLIRGFIPRVQSHT